MSQAIQVFQSADIISKNLAEMIIKDMDRLDYDQFYSIALSGGSTPQHLFSYLSENYYERISWDKLLVFWGDERCVPPESDESNFGTAHQLLLKNVPIPDANVFRIRGEELPSDEAVQYANVVSEYLPEVNGLPQFDMMLLGLGADGHTASIFPEYAHLFSSGKLFAVTRKPGSDQKRITATGKLINNASKIVFMVTGSGKADIVSCILMQKEGFERFPASMVKPPRGRVIWMLDGDAASLLPDK